MYQNLRHNIKIFENASLRIVWDWNLVINQELDTRYYTSENNIRAKHEVQNIMNGLKLFDIWRINNPCRNRYTWKQKKLLKMQDFFLVTEDFCNLAESLDIKIGHRSDHSLITLPISIYDNRRGKGFWKLNTSLLKYLNYINMIKDIINENVYTYATHTQNSDYGEY